MADRLGERIFSVSEITELIKSTLEEGFPEVAVQGEISNFRPSSTGHYYFSLKDRDALLSAVMYMPYIFSFFFSEAADRARKMHVIAFGLLIGAVSFILLSFLVHQLWIIILAAMISLSMAIVRPAYNGMITRLTPRGMLGEATGLDNLAMRLGYIVGPILTGFISDRFGLQFSFVVMAGIALSLCGFTLLLRGYDYLPKTVDYNVATL